MKKRKEKKFTSGGIVDLLAVLLAVATLLGLLGRLHWTFDLLSHFRVQYMQMGLILIGLAIWKRMNQRAVALVLLAGLNYAFVLPLYVGTPAPATTRPIRAMLMNLNAGNGNTALVLETIRNTEPDLLLLEEVTFQWARELAVLNADYPYRMAEARDDCFGIMLLSKHPLERGEIVEVSTSGGPAILAEAHFPQDTVSIIGTHLVPPINAVYAKRRNRQLTELPHLVRKQNHPVLLLGDLNATPFSYWFRRVLAESGLKNSMKGFGFQPSWGRNAFLKIPIDHVLHAPEITIHNRAVLGTIGSDHFPVIVDFSVN